MRKKPTDEILQHPVFGEVVNVTEPDATGKCQRVSESGHTVVDVKCADGERRTLLLSSFAPEPSSAPAPERTPEQQVTEESIAA